MKRKGLIILFHIFCIVNTFIVCYITSSLHVLFEGFSYANLNVAFLLQYRNLLFLIAVLLIISDVIFSFLVPFNTKETE